MDGRIRSTSIGSYLDEPVLVLDSSSAFSAAAYQMAEVQTTYMQIAEMPDSDPRKGAKMKKKMKKKEETKCPMCGLEHTDTEPATYECIDCGGEAFDCCLAGSGMRCGECEERLDGHPSE